MGRNLGPLNIKNSYEGLVQISGSSRDILTDGSGSSISNLIVTASYATVAATATSASYALTSTSASHAVIADSSLTSISSSYASTATSASYAVSASFATTASYAENAGASTLQEVLDNSNTATGVDIILTGSYLRHSASFSGNVIDNITDIFTGSDAINHVISLTQAEYNALTPASDTFYTITDAESTMITGSVSSNVLTFTKADGTTFPLTVDTGSGGVAFPFTGSAQITGSLGVTGSVNINGALLSGDGTNSVGTNLNEAAVGGRNNAVTGNVAGAFGGEAHTVSGFRAGAFGGEQSTVSGTNSFVVGGYANTAQSAYDGVIGGTSNRTAGPSSVIVGGVSNLCNNTTVGVIVGSSNTTLIGGNDNGLFALGLYIGEVNVNGGRGTGIIGGSNNKIVNFDGSTGDLASGYSREMYGGIIFGYQNLIARGTIASTAQGRNGFPLLLGGYQNQIGATTTNGGIFTSYSTIINSSGSSVDSGSFQGIIGGYKNQVSGSDNSYIIASNNSTIDSHNNSVILGGSSLTTTKDNEVVVPSLVATELTASGLNYPSADGAVGEFITTDGSGNLTFAAGGGGAAFPYTGSAQITGSLGVTGSIATGDGTNSVGTNGNEAAVGGRSNSATGNTAVAIGGESHTVTGFRGGAFAGEQLTIGGTNCFGMGGYNNSHNGSYGGVIGGTGNVGSGASNVILGGTSNNVSHDRSVILGGNSLSSKKVDEVTVPNLTISGSAVGEVGVLTDAAGTTTMDCSTSNFFTLAMPAGGTTALTPSNIQAGQTISVKITQNATAALLTFAASVDFEGGTAFTISTGASEVDVMTFVSFDGTTLQATGLTNFS